MANKISGGEGFVYQNKEQLVKALQNSLYQGKHVATALDLFSKGEATVAVSGNTVTISRGEESISINLNKLSDESSIFTKTASKIFGGKKEDINRLATAILKFAQKEPPPKEEKQDIVCEFSQGRLTNVRSAIGIKNTDDDNKGSLACAVICLKAVESFFQKGPPKTEKEIYQLIDQGVSHYMDRKFQGLQEFDEIYSNMDEKVQSQIKNYVPTAEDGSIQRWQGFLKLLVGFKRLSHN